MIDISTTETTKTDQKIAKSMDLEKIAPLVKSIKKNHIEIEIHETKQTITIPKNALFLLLNILQGMAEGKSITLVPSESEISTQQAADMLNVSRPHLVKLLENGNIPFHKAGAHRRIRLTDLVKYQNQLQKEREKQLKFLAQQAQDLDMGYE